MRKLFAALLGISLCACAAPASGKPLTITSPVPIASTSADMSGYEWIGEETGDFQSISWGEMFKMVEEGGSGIVYIGKTDCDFCQRAIPILNEAILETGVTAYVVDLHEGSIEEYYKAEDLLSDTFDKDSSGQPVFYVPEVFGIKAGVFTGSQISLVDNFIPESDEDQLSQEQHQRLREKYIQIIEKTAD